MMDFINLTLQTITLVISISILFHYNLEKKIIIIMLISGTIIGYPLFIWQGLIGIFILLCMWICILLIYKNNIYSSIIYPVITLINLVISDYIVNGAMLLLTNSAVVVYKQSELQLLLYVISICIVTVLLSVLISKILPIFSKQNYQMKSYGIMVAALSIVTLIIFYFNILIGKQSGYSEENIQANSLLFVFYFGILIGVCVLTTRLIIKENNIRNQRLQYERLTEYTHNLENMYTNMQKFRHDYINILLSMSEYIRSRDMDNLENYFNKNIIPISTNMQSNTYKLGSLHNLKVQELKGIISSKIIRAQEQQIDANVEVVEQIESIKMDPVDLCRCVGIILDNAIEEALHCDSPFVHVALFKRSNSHSIIVSNSSRPTTPDLHVIYTKGFSTKGENRGLGLNNLKEIVAKHNNVTLDTEIVDGKFTQILDISV